jgi:YD repeat-containing protein
VGTGARETFYSEPRFDEFDRLSGFKYGNGLAITNTYFANSRRLARLQTRRRGGGYCPDLSYTFDRVANLKSITDARYTGGASASLTNIVYDDLHRLTSLTATADGTKTYGYDAVGNILINNDSGVGRCL